jgi:hypothetical protein
MAFSARSSQITIPQTFAQWLGKLSNCNVVIQQKSGGLLIYPEIRLYCTECHQSGTVECFDVLTNKSPISESNVKIAEFARAHRHDAAIPVPLAQSSIDSFDERKFRTDI